MREPRELAEELEEFLEGKRHRLFSEVEDTLVEIKELLENMPKFMRKQVATVPVQKLFHISLTYEDDIRADCEEDVQKLLINKNKLMKMPLVSYKIDEVF